MIEFYNLPYIGFTADIDYRLELHILNSLEPPHKPTRTFKEIVPLQKAIRFKYAIGFQKASVMYSFFKLVNVRIDLAWI